MQEAHPNSYSSIYSKLIEARGKPLSECRYKFLSPVEKLSEPKTHAPWEFSTCTAVTVRLKDILNKSGRSERPVYKKIKGAGGIHEYIGFDGNVILTSIMEDQTIWGFTKEQYATIIDTLKPDYYITSDGETYNNEPNLSGSVEIPRMMEEKLPVAIFKDEWTEMKKIHKTTPTRIEKWVPVVFLVAYLFVLGSYLYPILITYF